MATTSVPLAGAGLDQTTCEEQAVRDAEWLEPTDDGPDGTTPRRARPLLLALASLPWLMVIGLLVLPGRMGTGDPAALDGSVDVGHDGPHQSADASTGDESAEHGGDGPDVAEGLDDPESPDGPERSDDIEAGSDAGDDADPASGADTGGTDARDDVLALEALELRGRWRVEAGPEEAVALAVVAARAWLTGVEPVLDLGLDPGPQSTGGYAEHLVVEAVEQPGPDALVVTLVAVVLDTGGGPPTVRRLAVPVSLTPDGPRLAGTPWELPPPVLDRITLAHEAITDELDLDAARAALVLAGLGDVDLVALHRTDGWPVIAEVSRPGIDVIREVWLRRHLDGYVVSGTTLAGAAAAEPDPAPAAEPGPADSDPAADPDSTETRS